MLNRVSILGCGWLGKPLGTALVDAGYSVMGSTTKNENIVTLEATCIKPFVCKVDAGLSEDIIRSFFHTDVLLISLPHGARAGKAETYIDQIRAVIAAAQRAGTGNILLISTTSVYENLNRVVTEDDADERHPIVQAEQIVRRSGIPHTILRFAGLFGPVRHPGGFLAGKRDVAGGQAPVNLIHLSDCIEIIQCVIRDNVWNQVLNACADGHPTRKTFYTRAAVELGLQPPVFLDDRDTPYKVVSNGRLKMVLNYTFAHTLI